METLVIIDGNALMHRAFHAIPPLTARDGKVVNAVYGFTTILLRTIRELAPQYVAVAFDAPGKTFRHELYSAYKATRVKQPQDLYDQFPIAKQVVEGLGFPIFEVIGVEADDVIATIADRATHSRANVKVIIVTGDMDTLQLISPRISVHTMRKSIADIVEYDSGAVKQRFGLSPSQMTDYKALRGDASDNIKGVPGIGDKTAVELLQKFDTLENIYTAVEKRSIRIKPSVIERLSAHKHDAFDSKALVVLKKDVDIDFNLRRCAAHTPDTAKLIELFRTLDFHSLIKRITAGAADAATPHGGGVLRKNTHNPQTSARDAKSIIQVASDKEYAAVLKKLKTTDEAAFLPVFSGLPPTRKLESVVVSCSAHEAHNIHAEFADKELWVLLQTKQCITFDLKLLISALLDRGIAFNPSKCMDIMLMDYVAHPGSRNHTLDDILLKQTGFTELAIGSQPSLFGADTDLLGKRVCLLQKSAYKLKDELSEKRLWDVYARMEIPLVSALAAMESVGIQLDVLHVKTLSRQIAARILQLTKKIHTLAGREFNIASPAQLKEILFDTLDIPVDGIRRGKTGLSTAASELEKLQGLHPIIDLIMEYREMAKLQNTYTDVLPDLVDSGGRVHTTFNQAVTSTGRLSSSDPNLQNIPIKTDFGKEIRKAFVARPGYVLIKADYSQIELRIAAALSKDREMIQIFERGLDIHRSTAAKINNVRESEVTPSMRGAAKSINFGIIYGLGAHSLAESAHMSFAEARAFIVRYFEVFEGVKIYLEELKLRAHTDGFVETYFGRRRYFPEINSAMPQVRAAAERMAINAPMQGTAADIIKLAMVQLHKFLSDSYAPDDVAMVLQVHDELVFEAREGIFGELLKPIKHIMENVVDFGVPLVVDIKTGQNWGEME